MKVKLIIVSFKNSDSVEMIDIDDSDIEEYTQSISHVLENNNVTILHLTSGSMIIRPNEVSSIVVTEEDGEIVNADSTSEVIIDELDSQDPPPEQVQEDIITD